MKNPLSRLLIDENQPPDLSLLSNVLAPYIGIRKSDGSIEPNLLFRELPNEPRILLYCAAVKARKHLGLSKDDSISQKELISADIMPTGSVKATLKKLADEHKLSGRNGRYFLPNHQLDTLEESLNIAKK